MRLIIRSLLFSFLLCCMFQSKASDTAIVSQLLHRIDRWQVKSYNPAFSKGLFPCYRVYALNKEREIADNNIIFTGYIIYTLKSLMPKLTTYQQGIAKQIIQNSSQVFAKYKNKNGRNTYNFWPTDTIAFFPNSGLLSKFSKSHSLADDLDGTSILLMAQSVDTTIAEEVHLLMQEFVNDKKMANNFFKNYANILTYSTWFGKKMPVEIDISVLCNVLLYVQSYQLAWTKTDSSTLQLIIKIIKDKKHITDAPLMSHYYPTSALILYHVSRLMAQKEIPELNQLKPQMIEEAKNLYLQSTTFMETAILSTTLLRWNSSLPQKAPIISNANSNLIEDDKTFSFFIANLAYLQTKSPDEVKKIAGKWGVGKFYFYCPAYNNMLVIENLIWQNLTQSNKENISNNLN